MDENLAEHKLSLEKRMSGAWGKTQKHFICSPLLRHVRNLEPRYSAWAFTMAKVVRLPQQAGQAIIQSTDSAVSDLFRVPLKFLQENSIGRQINF